MITLRATEVFNDSKKLIIAIESVDCRQTKTGTGCQLYGKIEPIAVIVSGPDGKYAFDMEARVVLLEKLKQDIPELDDIVASFNNA